MEAHLNGGRVPLNIVRVAADECRGRARAHRSTRPRAQPMQEDDRRRHCGIMPAITVHMTKSASQSARSGVMSHAHRGVHPGIHRHRLHAGGFPDEVGRPASSTTQSRHVVDDRGG
jgi:hypothetical protein